ncbi:MAG: adenylate/guanylate cyclase domain-containing protein [Actinomycetota bacterium]
MTQVLESPLEAGRAAAARNAWSEAFDLLNEADKDGVLTADDLDILAEAAWWRGKLEESIAARERAYTVYSAQGDERRAALMALWLSQDYFAKRANAIGAGWFGKAERILEAEPEGAEHGVLWLMHGMAASEMNQTEEALAYLDKGLDLGTRYGNRDVLGLCLVVKGATLVKAGRANEGLALLDEATVAAVSGELGPKAAGFIYCIAISASAQVADYRRAGEWTEASKRWCERQSISGFPGICRVHRAEIMRLRGAWAEAEQEARRALTELQTFNLQFAAEGFYELGEVRFRMGDLPGAEDAFTQAHELGRSPQPGLAILRLAQGKEQAAEASLRRALDEEADRLTRARLLPAQVEVALVTGDLDTARAAVEELEQICETYDSMVLRAMYLCARGGVELAAGDVRVAVSSLEQSLRLWIDEDLPYEAARARLMLGLAMRADDDEEGARLELGAAKSAFEKLGAVLDLRRAIDLLGGDVAETLPKASVPALRVQKTFMFTDIVGSTNLAGAMGDEQWGKVLQWHDEALREAIAAHRGEEVKHVGDGFFVAFDDPSDAIECAVAIQQRLVEHRRDHGFAPQVRIGLHVADATRKADDYEGVGVHEAARIGAIAGADEILASMEVIDAVRTRFPVSDARTVELKGIAAPIEVASIEFA